jgi:phage tail-like protein
MANGAADNEGGAPQAGKTTWVDPLGVFNFRVEILGITEGRFAECLFLGATVQAIEYRQGGINQVVHHLPGFVKYNPLTLKFGVTKSDELWKWFMSGVEGKLNRKSLSIVHMENDGVTEAMRWNLSNAWVSEMQGAQLNALGNETAIAKMVIVYDELTLEVA